MREDFLLRGVRGGAGDMRTVDGHAGLEGVGRRGVWALDDGKLTMETKGHWVIRVRVSVSNDGADHRPAHILNTPLDDNEASKCGL